MTQDVIQLLLIEDNSADARLVRELLAEAEPGRYAVIHVERLDAAIQRLGEAHVDVALLDMSLPDSQGIATLSALLAAAPGLPVVVLSGLEDERIALEAVQCGAQDYLTKGFNDGKVLARSLRYAIERQQVRNLSARLGRIFDASANEMYIFDATTFRFVQVNQGALANLGYDMQQLASMTTLDIKLDFDRASFETLIEPLFNDTQSQVLFETRHRRRDGSTYPVEIRLQLSRNERPPVFLALAQDITERKQARERMVHLANHDNLTGLPNRSLLQDRLEQAIADAQRRHCQAAVLFIDLDRFKVINDTLGHDAGDELLKQVAERLTQGVRTNDTVARLGGDEFIVILKDLGEDDVLVVSDKLMRQFSLPFMIRARELFVTPSMGVAMYPDNGNDAATLLKYADLAMYHAKESGRHRLSYYTESMNTKSSRRLALDTALRHALERDEFILHYQPLLNIETGEITGAEALIRWLHPERGLINPDDFIPLAEETGLIVPIGEWVLNTACAQLRAWHQSGFDRLRVAVNLSARQFRDHDLGATVQRALQQSGLEGHYLDLELTESILLALHIPGLGKLLDQFNAQGLRLSMDDFGTGYSSLSTLRQFPFSVLKIDKSFIQDVTTKANSTAIVQAMIAMGHNLGMTVVAEGVETEEQLRFLRAHHCDTMQGFYFSKPLSGEDFERLLRADPERAVDVSVQVKGNFKTH